MKLSRLTCLVSLACVLIFSQTAPAAESAQSFNWTGPYAGVHLGYGWGNADTYVDPLPLPRISDDQAPSTVSPNPGGIVGGAQAGYNYQMGCFVVGIEADLSLSGMSGSQSVSPIINNDGTAWPGTVSAHESINWFGTLRPRLGYTVTPTLLVYGTGGLAYGDASYSANTNFGAYNNQYPASLSDTKVGWSVGGGVEYAISKCWTVKAEYLYMDLGNEYVNAGPVFCSKQMKCPHPKASEMSAFSGQAVGGLKNAIPREAKRNGKVKADRTVRIGAGDEGTGNYFEGHVRADQLVSGCSDTGV